MQYYHSQIYKSNNWLDTDESDPIVVIEQYYSDECFVHDADVCGNGKVDFAFELDNETVYYQLSYSWYMDYEPKWNIHNSHEIKKLSQLTFKFPGNRDWIDV